MNSDKNIERTTSTSIEVDKEKFEQMQKIFGIYDGLHAGFGTITGSKKGLYPDHCNEFRMKFMIHQGPYYNFNENSLKYVIYIDKDNKCLAKD
jgi:hypothetical protein